MVEERRHKVRLTWVRHRRMRVAFAVVAVFCTWLGLMGLLALLFGLVAAVEHAWQRLTR